MEMLRCTYESTLIELAMGKKNLFIVDVPDTTDVFEMYKILEEGEHSNIWMFQDGHRGHAVRNHASDKSHRSDA